MSRSLPLAARAALNAPETGEAFLILLTISHAQLAEPLRVTSDAVNTVSRGDTYVPFPFELALPDDSDNRSPEARLVIDNIDRQIVRGAEPDTVEARFLDFRLTNVSYDSQTVEGNLCIEDFTAEPFPAFLFAPGHFPGLF